MLGAPGMEKSPPSDMGIPLLVTDPSKARKHERQITINRFNYINNYERPAEYSGSHNSMRPDIGGRVSMSLARGIIRRD